MIAVMSSSDIWVYSITGIIILSLCPIPYRNARAICPSVKLPIPVSLSGVRFIALMVAGGISISKPPVSCRISPLSISESVPGAEWQLAQ
jgi:hypothetical protein